MAGITINGVQYAWGTLEIVIFGVPVTRCKSISYTAKQVKENLMGAGNEPVLRGRGPKSYTGSIELYMEDWNAIIQASEGKDPLSIPPFDIPVQWSGDNVNYKEDVLRFVEFDEDQMESKQGDTSTIVKINLVIGKVEHVS